MTSTQIIIGVPGLWRSHIDFIKTVAEENPGYLYTGSVLLNVETGEKWVLELHGIDCNMRRAFEIAGQNSITENDLNIISAHTFTAYIIGEGGSAESALALMNPVTVLLNSGGIAVKIETAGKAHSKYDWLLLADDKSLTALYYAYVTLVGDRNEAYSCGMHNLGLPDAVINANPSMEEASLTLEAFLLYLLADKPEIHTGHAFSVNSQSAQYQISRIDELNYQNNDLFYNPYGYWKLDRM